MLVPSTNTCTFLLVHLDHQLSLLSMITYLSGRLPGGKLSLPTLMHFWSRAVDFSPFMLLRVFKHTSTLSSYLLHTTLLP
jgi:hypothetical protein